MSEQDDFFVVVKGGNKEQREDVRRQLKDMSDGKMNLVSVGEEEGDITVHIKTACGEVDLTSKDLMSDGNVLETACNAIRCKAEAAEAEPKEQEEAPSDAAEGDQD